MPTSSTWRQPPPSRIPVRVNRPKPKPPENPPIPDGPLRLILQMVIANESSAAMRCRLVSRQWNRVALDQLKLHLFYKPSRQRMTVSLSQWINRPHISGPRNLPTLDQLCDSQLLPRAVDMMIVFQEGDFNIQPDMIQLHSHLHRSIDVHLMVNYISTTAGLRRLRFDQLPNMRLVSYSQTGLNAKEMRVVEGIISTAEHLAEFGHECMITSTLLDLISFLQQKQKIQKLSVRLTRSDSNLVAIKGIAALLPNVAHLHVEFDDFTGRLWFLEDFSNLTCLKITQMPARWIQQLSTIRLLNLIELEVQLRFGRDMTDGHTVHSWLISMGEANMPKVKQLSCELMFNPHDWNYAVGIARCICNYSPPTITFLTIKLSADYNLGVESPLSRMSAYRFAARSSKATHIRFIIKSGEGFDPSGERLYWIAEPMVTNRLTYRLHKQLCGGKDVNVVVIFRP